jgi:hypothetical protein
MLLVIIQTSTYGPSSLEYRPMIPRVDMDGSYLLFFWFCVWSWWGSMHGGYADLLLK